ncbi:MAG: flagellar biosynthesis protein FlhF [Planctomycetota bacterium]|nr:flagellar biosynthesis protein FlhF [Planctomycetota bacterium]
MTIKTYRGRSIADALAQLKKELGSSAVILNTRMYKTGGVLGFGARTIHEITATDHAPAAAPRPARPAPAAAPTAAPRRSAPPPPLEPAPPAPRAIEVAPEMTDPVPPALRQVAQMIMASNTRAPIEEELASIKKMVGQVLRASTDRAQPDMPEALFENYRRMLESEVASEIASEVASAVRAELSPGQMADAQAVRAAVLRRIASYIPVAGDMARLARPSDGRPVTIALIGPTGVGKTTTVAKLAATFKLRQNKRVGLITCDTYRIAAVDQLRTYASIINVPLKVASTPAEMRAACAALADRDVVLIDTAGRPPRDEQRLEELRALLAAAEPHQTHLVLSSAAAEPVLLEAAARFAPLGCDRVIMTKLDEAVNFGVVVNVLRRLNARLSFVTTGQEVPDHIEVAAQERLARLVLCPDAGAREPS